MTRYLIEQRSRAGGGAWVPVDYFDTKAEARRMFRLYVRAWKSVAFRLVHEKTTRKIETWA